MLACAIVVGAGVALVFHLLVTSKAEPAAWGVEMVGGVAIILAAWRITRMRWGRPMREMSDLVARIRVGDAPIEELSSIRGGPRVIVPVVQELLRELRQQQRELATLNEEMRQRVAQRTDALERTIGTLRHQATRDSLTGLFNRRFLDQYLPQVVRNSDERGMELTVVMGDLDHFKKLNDTLGHAAGDDLLRSVGQIIRSTVRGEDVPFRFGGDEFLIVMPGSMMEQGRALAGRLSSLIDALGRTIKVPQQPRLSFGVACLTDAQARTPEGLMSLADKALYECKRKRQGMLGGGAKGSGVGSGVGLQARAASLQCPAL
ncbi:MAG: diguanylate cyclase [Tepidisphaeraceae bacterium]